MNTYNFSKKIPEIISIEKISKILDHCKDLEKKYFIFFALNICTGAKLSQIREIKLNNIYLEERGIQIKSIYSSLFYDLYFFPSGFRVHLEKYIKSIEKIDSQWLFPKRRYPEFPMTKWEIRYQHRKISDELGFHITPDILRNTFRMKFLQNCMESEIFRSLRSEIDPSYYWFSMSLVKNSMKSGFLPKYKKIDMQKHYDKYFPYYLIKYFGL